VVIPVYNGAAFLPAAIENVLAQEYPALEIIVIDDGSKDDIARVVEELPVDVRFFPRENAGPAGARNYGIRDASGELIAFLDVDDFWPEGNLPVLVERMLADENIQVIHGRAQVVRETPESGLEYLGSPAEAFPYYIGAGLYRKTAFERVGLFDKELRYGEDTDWFNRAKEMGLPVEHIEEVTLFVRRHEANMTRGKTLVELNTLALFKKALDRRRDVGADRKDGG
jgi:glycosyltransferase involved in cell wall biosynthesis